MNGNGKTQMVRNDQRWRPQGSRTTGCRRRSWTDGMRRAMEETEIQEEGG